MPDEGNRCCPGLQERLNMPRAVRESRDYGSAVRVLFQTTIKFADKATNVSIEKLNDKSAKFSTGSLTSF